METDIDAQETNLLPDINPVDIPGHDLSPSIEDRLSEIEGVLHI